MGEQIAEIAASSFAWIVFCTYKLGVEKIRAAEVLRSIHFMSIKVTPRTETRSTVLHFTGETSLKLGEADSSFINASSVRVHRCMHSDFFRRYGVTQYFFSHSPK